MGFFCGTYSKVTGNAPYLTGSENEERLHKHQKKLRDVELTKGGGTL